MAPQSGNTQWAVHLENMLRKRWLFQALHVRLLPAVKQSRNPKAMCERKEHDAEKSSKTPNAAP